MTTATKSQPVVKEMTKAQKLQAERVGEADYVPVLLIDTTMFPNARDVFAPDYQDRVTELQKSIKETGQQQSCLVHLVAGGPQTKDTYAAVAGFTRIEAQRRIALEPLMHKYNKDHNVALQIEKKEDQDALLAAIPTECATALGNTLVLCKIVTISGDTPEEVAWKAAVENIKENKIRTDFTPAEICFRAAELMDQYGKTVQDMADQMGVNKVALAQEVNIGMVFNRKAVVSFLTTRDDGDPEAETPWSEKTRAAWAAAAELIADEIVRRMGIFKTAKTPEGIPFSHLRDAVSALNTEGRKQQGKSLLLHRVAAFDLLSKLVNIHYKFDADKEEMELLPQKKDTPEYSEWKSILADAKKQSKAMYDKLNGVTEPEAAEGAEASADEEEAEGIPSDEDLGVDDAAAGAAAAAKPAAKAEAGAKAPELAPEEAPSGKRAEKPTSNFNPRNPDHINGQMEPRMKRLAKLTTDPTATKYTKLTEMAEQLGAISSAYWCLSEDGVYNDLQDITTAYNNKAEAYVKALEAQVAEDRKLHADLPAFELKRPQLADVADLEKMKVRS